MTLRHMEIFLEVCQQDSMTLAAKKMYMTQPAISQAIRELEAHYQVQLFERMNSKLYKTESGNQLFEYALHIVSLFKEASYALTEKSEGEVIRVGVNFTVGITMIQEMIACYNNQFPSSHVRVIVNNSKTIEQMIRNNDIDIALIEDPIGNNFLKTIVFYHDKITIVAHHDHPVFEHNPVLPVHLSEEKLLLRESGAGVRELFEQRMYQAGFKVNPSWESASSKALINAAMAKLGIAVLPYHIVKAYIQSGDLAEVAVEALQFERELVVAYHKNKLLTDGMQAFIRICTEFPERSAKKSESLMHFNNSPKDF